MLRRAGIAGLAWLVAGCASAAPAAQPAPRGAAEAPVVLRAVAASAPAGRVVLRLDLGTPLRAPARAFSLTDPARLVVDLPGVLNGTGTLTPEVREGLLRGVRLVEAAGRTRVVLTLDEPVEYQIVREERVLRVVLYPPARAQAAGARALPGAFDLLQVWRRALTWDPSLRGAGIERDTGPANREVARSGLMPNLSFSANKSRYLVDQTSDLANSTQTLDYNSYQYGFTLRQPLYNADALAKLRQAHRQDEEGALNYGGRRNELAVRVVTVYFEVLQGEAAMRLAEGQIQAYSQQLEAARRRLHGGEGTRTDVAQAESQLALAQAELSAAQDRRSVAWQALGNLTGLADVPLAALPDDFALGDGVAEDVDAWLDRVRRHNPELRARQAGIEVARAGVDVASAAYHPRVDLMAGTSRATSDTLSLVFQTYNYRMVGVQLSMPLFTGGYVSGSVEQARLRLEKAKADLAVMSNNVVLEARRSFLAAAHGAERVRSYRAAVRAAEVALEGARVGVRLGTHTVSELLSAQRQLFTAQRDLAQASFQYLVARFQVMAYADDVDEREVAQISSLLAH